MAAADIDPEDALDALIEEGIVTESTDGELATTEPFERTQAVYHDTYVALGNDDFAATVAEVFDIDEETAGRRIEEEGLTREQMVAYLSLQSELDPVPGQGKLALMAEIVTRLTPESPVPDGVTEIDDDTYESFLAANPDAIVTVWKRFCDPCDEMKGDLEDILARIPGDIAVAAVEGEACDEFINKYDATAAPAVVVFSDGEHEETLTGRQYPEDVGALVDDHF